MIHKKVIIIVICVAIFSLVGIGIFLSNNSKNRDSRLNTQSGFVLDPKSSSSQFKEIEDIWEKRIEEIGVKEAYIEFKETYKTADFGAQHPLMHIFGELIYTKAGVDGLAVCDSTFAFGCYHGFFTRAISEEGMGLIPELDKICLKTYGPYGTGCQHGIGHGLIEYTGHSNLEDALSACSMTTQVNEILGCASGVFMEYNTPTIFTGTNVTQGPRRLDKNNPHYPCNTIVPEEYKSSCYYEISSWWSAVFNRDYEKIGVLCKEIDNTKHRELCYLGFGAVAPPSADYSIDGTIDLCKRMPDANAEVLCRAGASWVFFSIPEKRSLAPLFCEGLTKKNVQYCVQKSDLLGNGEINSGI